MSENIVEVNLTLIEQWLHPALMKVNDVLIEGEKVKKKDQWRKPTDTEQYDEDGAWSEHVDHAVEHLCNVDNDLIDEGPMTPDQVIEEVSHAATRSLMALQLLLEEKEANSGKVN